MLYIGLVGYKLIIHRYRIVFHCWSVPSFLALVRCLPLASSCQALRQAAPLPSSSHRRWADWLIWVTWTEVQRNNSCSSQSGKRQLHDDCKLCTCKQRFSKKWAMALWYYFDIMTMLFLFYVYILIGYSKKNYYEVINSKFSYWSTLANTLIASLTTETPLVSSF